MPSATRIRGRFQWIIRTVCVEPVDINHKEARLFLETVAWQEINKKSRMAVKRQSYKGVIDFLSEQGIHDETSDKANTKGEATTDVLATSEENHNHDNNHEDKPCDDETPETALTLVGTATCPMTPATIILPATISPPPTTTTATTRATTMTGSSGTSLSNTSGSSDTTRQSSETRTQAAASDSIDDSPTNSGDTCPTLQQEEQEASQQQQQQQQQQASQQRQQQEQEAYKRPRKPYTRGFGPQTTVDGNIQFKMSPITIV